ncbi:MAG: hypothetical protein Q9174_003144 [Haloplaca sp. 1 TL-2023]
MAPEVLYRVIYGTKNPTAFQRSLLQTTPAILHSHCRHKVLHCDYPAIIPSQAHDSVRGTYVRGLADRDLFRLDTFEGDQYERRHVKIRLLDVEGDEEGKGNVEGEEVEVQTYIWIAGEDELEKGEWDFGEFMREKKKYWVGARDEYSEVDEAAKANGFDPTGGRGANGDITKELESEEKKALESAV